MIRVCKYFKIFLSLFCFTNPSCHLTSADLGNTPIRIYSPIQCNFFFWNKACYLHFKMHLLLFILYHSIYTNKANLVGRNHCANCVCRVFVQAINCPSFIYEEKSIRSTMIEYISKRSCWNTDISWVHYKIQRHLFRLFFLGLDCRL